MRSTAKDDLAGFEEWLLQRRLADEFQLGHFCRWVRRFLYLRASRPKETWQDTLTVFLEDHWSESDSYHGQWAGLPWAATRTKPRAPVA